jgi:hypothetical protein
MKKTSIPRHEYQILTHSSTRDVPISLSSLLGHTPNRYNGAAEKTGSDTSQKHPR